MQKEEPAGDASNTRVMVLVVTGHRDRCKKLSPWHGSLHHYFFTGAIMETFILST
jgi:hypothetical protein